MGRVLKGTNRFFMRTPGGEAEAVYEIRGGTIAITHTFVPESERGKGIAEALVMKAFEFARMRHLRVKPECSYAAHFAGTHPEFSDIMQSMDG